MVKLRYIPWQTFLQVVEQFALLFLLSKDDIFAASLLIERLAERDRATDVTATCANSCLANAMAESVVIPLKMS